MISNLRNWFGAFIGMLAIFTISAERSPADSRPGTQLRVNTQDAVSYQENVAHTGSIRFSTGFAMPLAKAWSTSLSGKWASYPIIAGGMIFVNEASTQQTYALNLTTGATVWSQKTGAYTFGPAYDNGLVFTADGIATMYALSAQTGATKWKASIAAGNIIAINGQVFAYDAGSYGLTALSESNGQIQWSQAVAELGLIPGYGNTGVLSVSSCQYAMFNPASGAQVWHFDGGCYGLNFSTPVSFHKRVYITDIDLENSIRSGRTGRSLGTFISHGYPPAIYAVSGQTLAFSLDTDSYNNSTLYAWDASTGTTVWTASCTCTVAPIVVNGHVIIGDNGGNVYALAAKTGKQEWTDNVGGIVRQLSAGDGTLIVINDGGTVTAFVPS